eukprot:g5996.t1
MQSPSTPVSIFDVPIRNPNDFARDPSVDSDVMSVHMLSSPSPISNANSEKNLKEGSEKDFAEWLTYLNSSLPNKVSEQSKAKYEQGQRELISTAGAGVFRQGFEINYENDMKEKVDVERKSTWKNLTVDVSSHYIPGDPSSIVEDRSDNSAKHLFTKPITPMSQPYTSHICQPIPIVPFPFFHGAHVSPQATGVVDSIKVQYPTENQDTKDVKKTVDSKKRKKTSQSGRKTRSDLRKEIAQAKRMTKDLKEQIRSLKEKRGSSVEEYEEREEEDLCLQPIEMIHLTRVIREMKRGSKRSTKTKQDNELYHIVEPVLPCISSDRIVYAAVTISKHPRADAKQAIAEEERVMDTFEEIPPDVTRESWLLIFHLDDSETIHHVQLPFEVQRMKIFSILEGAPTVLLLASRCDIALLHVPMDPLSPWNVDDKVLVLPRKHENDIRDIAVSGNRFVSAGHDHRLFVWTMQVHFPMNEEFSVHEIRRSDVIGSVRWSPFDMDVITWTEDLGLLVGYNVGEEKYVFESEIVYDDGARMRDARIVFTH